MPLRNEKIASVILWLAMIGLSIWGHLNLPNIPMAIHFDASGSANGFLPRDQGLLIMPGLTLGLMVVMLWIIPTTMPKKASVERSAVAYGAVTVSVLLLMLAIHAMLVLSAAGAAFDHLRVVHVGVGLLFVIIGNFLPKMRYNYVMGIRSPWTLADERVWDKTHRFGGPVFLVSGLLIIAAGCFLPVTWQIATLLTCALGTLVITFAYSYLVAKGLKLT